MKVLNDIARESGNQEGSALIIVVLLILLLTVAGISSLNLTTTEIQIAGNDRVMKSDFYIAEGGCVETAIDVDKNSSSYPVTDINTPVLLTNTLYGNAPQPITSVSPFSTTESIDNADKVSLLKLANSTDSNWPVKNQNQDDEYAYRVYYRASADLPKGYDASKFGAYVFDVTVRKQKTENNKITEITSTINRGFKKIGPISTN